MKDLRGFNYALFRKWKWRLLVEKDCLWWKVLVSLYWESNKEMIGDGKTGSWRWTSIRRLGDGCRGMKKGWFLEFLKCQVGNGKGTSFWRHSWATKDPLKDRVMWLFSIANNREVTIENMGKWCDGVWVWLWDWRIRFFQW